MSQSDTDIHYTAPLTEIELLSSLAVIAVLTTDENLTKSIKKLLLLTEKIIPKWKTQTVLALADDIHSIILDTAHHCGEESNIINNIKSKNPLKFQELALAIRLVGRFIQDKSNTPDSFPQQNPTTKH